MAAKIAKRAIERRQIHDSSSGSVTLKIFHRMTNYVRGCRRI